MNEGQLHASCYILYTLFLQALLSLYTSNQFVKQIKAYLFFYYATAYDFNQFSYFDNWHSASILSPYLCLMEQTFCKN